MAVPKNFQAIAVTVAVILILLFFTSGTGTPSSLADFSSLATGQRGNALMPISERLALAEKNWGKLVAERETLKKEHPTPDNIPYFPAVDVPSYRQNPWSVWDFIPASFNCPHEMERVGRLGDGGKWVCGMRKYEQNKARPCVVYSFGVQFESTFEEQMIERTNCEVWGYDFSVTEFGKQLKPDSKARAHFMTAGIGGKTDPSRDPPFYTIKDLMKMNGHTYIDVLKMDIEYSEFEALEAFINDFSTGALPLGQLMVELHLFAKPPKTVNDFMSWREALEARGLRPVWTEPNLLAVTLTVDDSLPRLAEYTLINIHDKNSLILQE